MPPAASGSLPPCAAPLPAPGPSRPCPAPSRPGRGCSIRAGSPSRTPPAMLPHDVLDEWSVGRIASIEFSRLRQLAALLHAERVVGVGEEQAAHGCQLVQWRAAAELLLLVAVRPLVVAGRIDDRVSEPLE